MWALLAVGAMSFASSLMKGRDQAKAQVEHNKQVAKANLANAVDTAQTISTLDLQGSLLKSQAATARAESTRQAMLGKSGAEVQAASAGVRGASVDAVIADIDRELGWAEADLARNVDVEAFNMQTRLRSLITSRKAGVFDYAAVTSKSTILANAVTTGALAMGQAYTNNYFQYGASK